jgi:hypothetical protein
LDDRLGFLGPHRQDKLFAKYFLKTIAIHRMDVIMADGKFAQWRKVSGVSCS